ncbi:MAG: sarcosine oxidase subunit alpha family protein [Alphaproteobacteria bacterium]|nr:sarcosine oxidase subunit alpha family protein [Alphaproteobacteria bacterium]
MSQPFRTPSGGRIDRGRTLAFRFDGQRYEGHPGDTLASALLANGVHLLGRSFKYHRPRGILAAGADEPNALVTVSRDAGRTTPNLRATQVELHDGLVAESQNRWPSLRFDAAAITDRFAALVPAGFYYKTFMGPGTAWARLYEPRIRAMAGLGRAPEAADPDHYAQRYAHCDVLVVGAGAAGLAAALSAARAGKRVVLCDEQAELGGGLLAETRATIDGAPASAWLEAARAELAAAPHVRLLPRTTAFGYFADNFVALAQRLADHLAAPPAELPRECLWQIRARRVVLATGAIERPLVFPENDRPGIMLADAARSFATRYGVRPGRRAVVFAAHDSAYAAALDLAAAGVDIAAIADLRRDADGPLPAAARGAGIHVVAGATIVGTRGRLRVHEAQLGALDAAGRVTGVTPIACDLLLMGGGWTPSVHLFSQSRGKLVFAEALQAFVPGEPAQACRSAGACRGAFGLAAALDDGWQAGAEAVGLDGARRFAVADDPAASGGFAGAAPHDRNPRRVRAFVDFQNDVTAKDLTLALHEGFRSIEHVKRYTTTGMATDQGKTSNINALAIVAAASGRAIPAVGFTSFRQPYTPVTFGTFAGASRGALFDPVRTTPIHDWAQAAGAVFEDVGNWKRARYFPRAGEDMHAAVNRECRTVRTAVGVFDASTLGKIEVVGPDAAEFLERLYVNPFAKLGAGRCRYGILLREDGFVTDDGVIGRIAADRFHVTTTTGGAARVLAMMEDYHQTEWPDLRVHFASTTEQWAVIAVQGPRARDVLAPLAEGIDMGREAFPHMSLREGRLGGVPLRLFRVSFTGELGYEVNVPADHGRAAWELIWAQAQRHGAAAYGTEAMHVLRAEKGYIIVGQETDGTVIPQDLGLDWAIGKSKRDFVGKRSLARSDMVRPDRKQLVGLLTADPTTVLEEGAQITESATPAPGTPALGHVTSAYWSESLGRSIALALVEAGRARQGETLHVPMPGGAIPVGVAPTVFVDPEGKRLDG